MDEKKKDPLCKPAAYTVRVQGELKVKLQEDIQRNDKKAQRIIVEALKQYYKK